VRGFTEALRREAAPLGVNVSAVYPGGAATEFQKHAGQNRAKKRFRTPRWLSVSAEDVARAVVHLAKRPRRTLILPWIMMLSLLVNSHLTGLSDSIQKRAFASYHKEDLKKIV
jgi:short-subunit dehydrogenase